MTQPTVGDGVFLSIASQEDVPLQLGGLVVTMRGDNVVVAVPGEARAQLGDQALLYVQPAQHRD